MNHDSNNYREHCMDEFITRTIGEQSLLDTKSYGHSLMFLYYLSFFLFITVKVKEKCILGVDGYRSKLFVFVRIMEKVWASIYFQAPSTVRTVLIVCLWGKGGTALYYQEYFGTYLI